MPSEANNTAPPAMGQPVSLLDRVQTRLSGMRGSVTGFVSQPNPRNIGSASRGKQLISGNFQFGGHLVQQPKLPIWDVPVPGRGFAKQLHGFGWLDDLAAFGGEVSRRLAQNWVHMWIDRFDGGKGSGWSPDLTGRRMISWINHAPFLMSGQSEAQNARYFRSLERQAAYLGRRWSVALPGLPRFEALTGLLYAGVSLNGLEYLVVPTAQALAHECTREIGTQGGLPSRNPEELMEVLTLLVWAEAALKGAGHDVVQVHRDTIARVAAAVRAMRHANGRLARFHGGGAGSDIQLDRALMAIKPAALPPDALAMGYARLEGGKTSVIADVAPPPSGKAASQAHASTLAFELTSGAHPVIVNCGSGAQFGADWHRAGRATPSHSTLSIQGSSSAWLKRQGDEELLTDGPSKVKVQQKSDANGTWFMASHDGYTKRLGLTHVRKLALSADGRTLTGTDTLGALSETDCATFDRHMDAAAWAGVRFMARLHLHPDVDASLDMGGSAVSLSLPSGEVWVFRATGKLEMTLEPSVLLEKGRIKPRASQQIVLTSDVMEYATQVCWVLNKAQDAPTALLAHW